MLYSPLAAQAVHRSRHRSWSGTSTDVLLVLLAFSLMACLHKGNAMCHHSPPKTLRFRHPLRIICSDGLQEAIQPQVVEMRWNIEVSLTMEVSDALEVDRTFRLAVRLQHHHVERRL